jgi:hypothetical protein
MVTALELMQRKKCKNPLLGDVCLLTTGVLISVQLHTSGPMTVLPNEWHKTVPDLLLVFHVSGQFLRKETFFIKEPP